jgi:hypothetical protein
MFDGVPERLASAVRDIACAQERRLRYLFAANFVAAEYLGKNFASPEPDPFLDVREDEAGNIWYGYTVRVTMIGETLFLLRNCTGFPELCRRMKQRDLRSAYYEALAARLFFEEGFDIVARSDTRGRGRDFDFSAARGSDAINVEVTALTKPAFSSRTLTNALEKKRKQLEAEMPSVIFCAHPEGWFSHHDLDFALTYHAAKFFVRTGRVNAIVFTGERHIEVPGRPEGGLLITKTVWPHPSPRHFVDLGFLFRGYTSRAARMAVRTGQGEESTFSHLIGQSEFYRWVDWICNEQAAH